jgi:hypothetical protein
VLGQEILFRTVSGVFTAEIEIAMLQDALDRDLIGEKVIGMVINLNKAIFEMKINDVIKIVSFVGNHDILSRLKYAIIVDTPDKIIHPSMAEGHDKRVKVQPFTTEDLTLEWIILHG